MSKSTRLLAWAVAGLIALWLLSLTLRPGTQLNGMNLVPFSHKFAAFQCLLFACRSQVERRASAAFLFVDVLGNLAVFVPFGMAVAAATLPRRPRSGQRRFGWRWWVGVTAVGALLSLGIELAQLFIPTRATDIDDLILNTLGTVAGAALFRLFLSLR